jgi:hypothetical protein
MGDRAQRRLAGNADEPCGTLAAASPAPDIRAPGCPVGRTWLRLVAGVDSTNEPGRWPSDAVSEYPDAGAQAFALIPVQFAAVAEGTACLRNQLNDGTACAGRFSSATPLYRERHGSSELGELPRYGLRYGCCDTAETGGAVSANVSANVVRMSLTTPAQQP